jgi:hypothetical protein
MENYELITTWSQKSQISLSIDKLINSSDPIK